MATSQAPIGIVLVTHERLGEAFIETATHIMGERPMAIESVCSHGDRKHQQLHERIREACRHVNRGRGVLLLVDIFGSSPANFCAHFVDDTEVSAIAGVNLPLLLRALNYRFELNLPALVAELDNNHTTLIQKLKRRHHDCHPIHTHH